MSNYHFSGRTGFSLKVAGWTLWSHLPHILMVFLLVLVAQVFVQVSAFAQQGSSSVEEWRMTYEGDRGATNLEGFAKRSGGSLEMGWTKDHNAPDFIEKLRSQLPDWQDSATTNQSSTEVLFEMPEIVARVVSGAPEWLVNSKKVSQAEWARHGSDANQIAQRVALSAMIIALQGNLSPYSKPKPSLGVSQLASGVRLDGLRLRLFNPAVTNNGRSILWDWEAQLGFDNALGTTSTASGSRANNNPILWGPASEITHVLVANAQSSLDEKQAYPLYPRPTKQVKEATKDPQELKHIKSRELIVIGRKLDDYVGEPVTSGSELITYTEFNQFERDFIFGIVTSYTKKALNEKALAKADEVLSSDPELKAYWVTATINTPLPALAVPLSLGDVDGSWWLDYGDNSAFLSIIKPKRSEFLEPLARGGDLRRDDQVGNELFFRDEVVFEAQFKREIEKDSIDLQFIGDKVVFGKDYEAGTAAKVTLTRLKENPRRFRSKHYILGDAEYYLDEEAAKPEKKHPNDKYSDAMYPGKDIFKDVPPDRLLLISGQRWLRPRFAEALKIRIDLPSPDKQVNHTFPNVSGDFIEALKRATSCAGKSSGYGSKDWDRLTLEEESTIALGVFSRRSISISYGQHAAMLMVRRAFADLMDKRRNELIILRESPDTFSLFIEAAQNVWLKTPSPITEMAYAFHSGMRDDLRIMKAQKKTLYADNSQLNPEFVKSFRAMIARQYENARTAYDIVYFKDQCDVETLLTTVGRGFEPVVEKLKASVTRLHTNPKTGTSVRRPDMVAIRELDTLPATLAQYNLTSKYSDAQWEAISMAIAAVGLGTGLTAAYLGAAGWGMVALAADSADFALTCQENICGYYEDRERLRLGNALTGFTGSTILNEALDKNESGLWRITKIGMSGAAVGVSAFDYYRLAEKAVPKEALEVFIDTISSPALPADIKDAYEIGSGAKDSGENLLGIKKRDSGSGD